MQYRIELIEDEATDSHAAEIANHVRATCGDPDMPTAYALWIDLVCNVADGLIADGEFNADQREELISVQNAMLDDPKQHKRISEIYLDAYGVFAIAVPND